MVKIYVLEKNCIPFYIGKAKNTIRRKHSHARTYGLDIQLHIITLLHLSGIFRDILSTLTV